MTHKSLFLIPALFVLSVSIFSCSSGTRNGSQNLHTICQGFSLTCQHGGTCGEGYLGNNQYNDTCTCPAGYEGVLCETPSRDKFIGTYVGTMSQEYPGGPKVDTFPDTVTIIADADETKAIVRHLYQFMTLYAPAQYDTLICQASYGFLEGPTGSQIQFSFTDQSKTKLHFECYNTGAYGGLTDSWFDGTRQ